MPNETKTSSKEDTSLESFPDKGLVRLPQILKIVPISPSTWWKWIREGKAPKGRKLARNVTVWKAEEILSFVVNIDNVAL